MIRNMFVMIVNGAVSMVCVELHIYCIQYIVGYILIADSCKI